MLPRNCLDTVTRHCLTLPGTFSATACSRPRRGERCRAAARPSPQQLPAPRPSSRPPAGGRGDNLLRHRRQGCTGVRRRRRLRHRRAEAGAVGRARRWRHRRDGCRRAARPRGSASPPCAGAGRAPRESGRGAAQERRPWRPVEKQPPPPRPRPRPRRRGAHAAGANRHFNLPQRGQGLLD